MPQKILCTILAPEEPISADPTVKEHTSDSPTVDVGPAANLRAGLAAADFPSRPNKARARQLPGAGLIVLYMFVTQPLFGSGSLLAVAGQGLDALHHQHDSQNHQ